MDHAFGLTRPYQSITTSRPIHNAIAGWTTCLGVAALYALTCLIACPFGDFAVLDDWIFASSVHSILDTGRFVLPDLAAPNLVVQAYWGALFCLPFGFSLQALKASTLVAGAGGVVAMALLLRELGASWRLAGFGALTLAFNPFYFQLSPTFMTDVPFTALATASLWLYVRGANRDSNVGIGCAYGCALLAIMVRQFALILPLAFGAAHIWRKGFRAGPIGVAILPCILMLVLQLCYGHWFATSATTRPGMWQVPLEKLLPTDPVVFLHRVKYYLMAVLPYIGLFAAPFVLGAAMHRQPEGRPRFFWTTSVVFGALLFMLLWKERSLLPVGAGAVEPGFANLLLPFGLGPITMLETTTWPIPSPWIPDWRLMSALGAWVTGTLLLLCCNACMRMVHNIRIGGDRSNDWKFILFFATSAAYVAGILAVGAARMTFDRYLLFLTVPSCALALLALPAGVERKTKSGWLPGALVLGAMSMFTMTATHDFLSSIAARSAATEWLARSGVQDEKVDGGYEYNGPRFYDVANTSRSGNTLYAVPSDEYLLSFGRERGYEEIRRFPFATWLWPTPHEIFVLHRP